MRGQDIQQAEWFSYKTLEERIPEDHPLRTVRVLTNGILKSMDSGFEKPFSRNGRPSIPPERLLRAILIQIFYTVRSERQLMGQLDFNLLFRWFVGLDMDGAVWDHSTFSQNRGRLLTESLTRDFFGRVVAAADGYGLLSDEHFSVDGTLIEAWASPKSFRRKDDKGKSDGVQEGGNKRDPEVNFKGELRCNDTHASGTDPEPSFTGKAKVKKRNSVIWATRLWKTDMAGWSVLKRHKPPALRNARPPLKCANGMSILKQPWVQIRAMILKGL